MISRKAVLTDSPHMSYAENSSEGRPDRVNALLLHPEEADVIKTGRGGYRPGAGRKPKPKAIPCSLGLRWCCAESAPGYFDRAVASVRAMGFQVHAPMQPVRRRVPVKAGQPEKFEIVNRPKFFQYFFVLLDLDGFDWARIRPSQESGVSRLILTTGLRPAPVRQGIIEALIADDERRAPLPKQSRTTLDPCLPGSSVLIVRGHFEGQIVEVVRCDGFTTTVLLSGFGGMVPARLSRNEVSTE
ncbi:MAG TPA: hypothetical protein VMH92_05650 [Acidocella sp.]|nr:hypothetical protein [Acidocella sp.]